MNYPLDCVSNNNPSSKRSPREINGNSPMGNGHISPSGSQTTGDHPQEPTSIRVLLQTNKPMNLKRLVLLEEGTDCQMPHDRGTTVETASSRAASTSIVTCRDKPALRRIRHTAKD
jgi:hypothetical protein